jgi:TPR repeat protein
MYSIGEGVDKDIVKAVNWYRKAEEQGHDNSTKALKVMNDACRKDWRNCVDNEMFVDGSPWEHTNAKVACKRAVSNAATHGEPEFNWVAFGSYYKGDDYIKTGIVKLTDDEVMMFNGFGGKSKTSITCRYDINSKTVLGIVMN